ncbi:hypothetical protein QQF64_029235 [Cirrhinus molitorella]|uniref:Uncharacterized protein n=1 Tax=Cirrhinus molitorella TaxID=172907 RepID=A0ABR3N8V3_9TELE
MSLHSCLCSNIYGLRSVSLFANSCRSTNLPQPLHKSPSIAQHLKATNLTGLRSCGATGGAVCLHLAASDELYHSA